MSVSGDRVGAVPVPSLLSVFHLSHRRRGGDALQHVCRVKGISREGLLNKEKRRVIHWETASSNRSMALLTCGGNKREHEVRFELGNFIYTKAPCLTHQNVLLQCTNGLKKSYKYLPTKVHMGRKNELSKVSSFSLIIYLTNQKLILLKTEVHATVGIYCLFISIIWRSRLQSSNLNLCKCIVSHSLTISCVSFCGPAKKVATFAWIAMKAMPFGTAYSSVAVVTFIRYTSQDPKNWCYPYSYVQQN